MVSIISEVVKEVVLSPRAEKFHTAVRAKLSPRVKSLSGKAICVVDNHKPNAQPLMDSIAQALSRDYAPRKVTRFHKEIAASPLKDEVLKEIQAEYDVAIEGMGSWGACTSWCIHDVVKMERLGLPSVGIIMPNFEKLARSEAAMLGLPDLRIVVPTRAVLGDTLVDAEQIRILTEAILPEIVNLLAEAR